MNRSSTTIKNPVVAKGFTLIEIMLVLLLLGLALRISVPFMRNALAQEHSKKFFHALNSCVAQAWHSALQTNRAQQVLWDFTDNTIRCIALDESFMPEKQNSTLAVLPQFFQNSVVHIDPNVIIKEFFVDGKNYMARTDKTVQTVWFYINAQGISQEVIINAIMPSDSIQNPKQYSLVLNPFRVQFGLYDTFQKP